jgi:hypothetical protein
VFTQLGLLLEVGLELCLKIRRADARVVAGNEGLIAQFRTGVTCVDVCDYLACVLLCTQEPLGKFGKRYPLGTGYFDSAVDRCPNVTSRPDCDDAPVAIPVAAGLGAYQPDRRLPLAQQRQDQRKHQRKHVQAATATATGLACIISLVRRHCPGCREVLRRDVPAQRSGGDPSRA